MWHISPGFSEFRFDTKFDTNGKKGENDGFKQFLVDSAVYRVYDNHDLYRIQD